MRDLSKRGRRLFWSDQKLKMRRLSRERSAEGVRVEACAIFHIFFKGTVRDKLHLIFQKNVPARNIRKTITRWRSFLSDGYSEDGFQKITRSRATCKESG